jgi:hypothetical protein
MKGKLFFREEAIKHHHVTGGNVAKHLLEPTTIVG